MSDEEQSPESRRRWKRRLLWTAVLAALLLALVLTPPLINVNRLARRIATSMSNSLGRPVHLDNVSLTVLPFPGLTLQNLVVSEDPSFGAEPVIRANRVTARLRLSSLWRRQVEFSTIDFQTDEFGSGASVNLVRRTDGRWNLESILLHAAQQDAAPTAQTTAGAAPRFPYIEATGARINIKLGDEKQPLSLMDTDFALWLPSPQQWRLRLSGRPARTDTNVSDTGLLRVEGTLRRATTLADVPVEIAASWRRPPLGEVSRLLGGSDAGWRGNAEATAVLRGTLGQASLTATLKLSDVRRSDFIPAKTIQLAVECAGQFAVTTAELTDASCTMPTEGSGHDDPGTVAATADSVNLAALTADGLKVGMSNVRDVRVLDWARLFSQRLPADWNPQGVVSGSVSWNGPAAGWQGEVHDMFMPPDAAHAVRPKEVPAAARVVSLSPQDGKLVLAPVNLATMEKTPLILSGAASAKGYTLALAGTATPDELQKLQSYVPPLADGLAQALPQADRSAAPARIDVSCARNWNAAQTCMAARAPEPVKRPARRRR